MNEMARLTQSTPFLVGTSIALAACLAGWIVVARRLAGSRPLVPYQGRRPVPWGGLEVLLIVVAYVVFMLVASLAGELFWGLDLTPAPPRPTVIVRSEHAPPAIVRSEHAEHAPGDQLDAAHPLIVLLHGRHSLAGLLVCVLSAVVVAPVVEEFLFRLLLQGWLERLEGRLRRAARLPARLVGTAPVVASSLLFASMHYRRPAPLPDADSLLKFFVLNAAAQLAVLLFGVALLRLRCGATSKDLGIQPDRLHADLRLGLAAFALVTVPVYLLQALLTVSLGPEVVPDPAPLFFLALALGFLYFRTHRLPPAIVLHAAFNAVGIALAWTMLGG